MGSKTYLHVSVSLEVEYGETAHEPETIHVYRELSEEIDDSGSAAREGEPQYERCQDDGDDLLHKREDLHVEQLPELLMDL